MKMDKPELIIYKSTDGKASVAADGKNYSVRHMRFP